MIAWPDATDERRTGFNLDLPPNGYAWWRVSATSDDGSEALSVTAFIGALSPYYARAQRGGAVDPLDHSALNVALVHAGGRRWAMTERPKARVARNVHSLLIGPSDLGWDGRALTININEICAPIPRRIRGRVRVVPQAVTRNVFMLNPDGNHRWWPIAPRARVEVALQQPQLSWSGEGCIDAHAGDAPIETGFTHLQSAYGALHNTTAIFCEAEKRDGGLVDLAMTFDRDGNMERLAPPPPARLKRSGWMLGRSVPSEGNARVLRTLDDSPLHARSLVEATLLGESITLIHDSLSLDRFRMKLVQALLPFRMPRRR